MSRVALLLCALWISGVAQGQMLLISGSRGAAPAGGGDDGACADSQYADLNGNHWPDSSCTGLPAGTSLTSYSGSNPITVNGTTITAKRFTSCPLVIQAINVTIDDSHFDCSNDQAVSVLDDSTMWTKTSNGTVYAVTISDTTIDCGATSGGLHGVSEAHVYLLRVDLSGCENGMDINQNIRVENSYLHDQAAIGDDPHEDGIQDASNSWNGSSYSAPIRNIILIGNTIDGQNSAGSPGTSAYITNPNGSGTHTVTGNWFMGAGFSFYCPDDDATGWMFEGNVFSTTHHPKVGLFGPITDCGQFASQGTWSGNYCAETGAVVNYNSSTTVCD